MRLIAGFGLTCGRHERSQKGKNVVIEEDEDHQFFLELL